MMAGKVKKEIKTSSSKPKKCGCGCWYPVKK